jgi:RNA polymerase sigma-70 factor, ECF subfamily
MPFVVGGGREDPGDGYVTESEAMHSRPALAASALVTVEDRREFDEVVEEHLPGLRSRAIQLCREHLDPDDLLQDTLIRAFRARHKLRDAQSMRAWLLSILGNVFIDEMRKQRARPPHIPLDDSSSEPCDESTEPLPWERIDSEQFRMAIEQLPHNVCDTYRLFALESYDYVEIAAALGIPKSTVGTRLLRARKLLRELLADLVEEMP